MVYPVIILEYSASIDQVVPPLVEKANFRLLLSESKYPIYIFEPYTVIDEFRLLLSVESTMRVFHVVPPSEYARLSVSLT